MTRKKILFYEPYANNFYGNSRYILTIFQYLDREIFEPVLLSPVKNPFLEMVESAGGRCTVVEPPAALRRYAGRILKDSFFGRFATAFALLRYSFALLKEFRKEKPDIIQCHNIRGLITVCLAAKLLRRPILWYVKGDLENRILDLIGFLAAKAILFQSEITRDLKYPILRRVFAGKIRIIRNGVDIQEICHAEQSDARELKRELGLDGKHTYLGFLGTLCPRKGVDVLFRAFARVLREEPNVRLYVVGDEGPPGEFAGYQEELKRILDEERLEGKVVLTGWRRDAIRILSVVDIFVLPAFSEGVPKSIIEAMALGKPVVATRVGGVLDAVQDSKTGFVVEAGDVASLADRLICLIRSRELRTAFGKRAKEVAYRDFSIRRNIAELEDLYRRVGKQGERPAGLSPSPARSDTPPAGDAPAPIPE